MGNTQHSQWGRKRRLKPHPLFFWLPVHCLVHSATLKQQLYNSYNYLEDKRKVSRIQWHSMVSECVCFWLVWHPLLPFFWQQHPSFVLNTHAIAGAAIARVLRWPGGHVAQVEHFSTGQGWRLNLTDVRLSCDKQSVHCQQSGPGGFRLEDVLRELLL